MPRGRRKPGLPHSDFPGVCWNAQKGKWRGKVLDRSVRVGKKAKQIHVGLFVDEQACADAVAAKQAEVEAAIAQKLHAMAQELEHTRGLPPRPARAADAQPETAYYGERGMSARGSGEAKEFGPARYVRGANESLREGFVFMPCCRAFLDSGDPCTSKATKDRKHCVQHGGGFRVGEARGNSFCTHCKTLALRKLRQPQHGGKGLCVTCEAHLQAKAAANGAEAPLDTQKRIEEHVFELLLPLLKYANGAPFPPDQRDERKGGGFGDPKSKKRRRECDTTTNRFPDGLWVLRDEDGHIVLLVIVEVDEDSHRDRDPKCESGKVDDTFQALQDVVLKEGARRGAVARHGAHMVPVVFLRVNPNAYDGPRTKLKDRVQAVADRFHHYAHMPAAERAKLPTHGPIVHVMYYHSKHGAQNLAHLREVAPQAGWTLTVHA